MRLMKVSVILPTYNGRAFIARAVRSVLEQSFRDLELIVVDDGSTDGTGEEVKRLAADRRIKYLKNGKNLGIQRTLNAGLRAAEGELIARIDDDDEWCDKDKLKKQVDFLNTRADHALVGTGTIVVDEKGNELFRFLNPETDEKIRRSALRRNCFTHSSVIFRKAAALEFGGYDESSAVLHAEDYDLWLKIGTRYKFANLPFYGVRFTARPGALSGAHRTAQFLSDLRVALRRRRDYPGFFGAWCFGAARLGASAALSLLPRGLYVRLFRAYKSH